MLMYCRGLGPKMRCIRLTESRKKGTTAATLLKWLATPCNKQYELYMQYASAPDVAGNCSSADMQREQCADYIDHI